MGLWGKLTGRLSREEFVEESLAGARAAHPEARFDAGKFAVRWPDHTYFLANVWAEYQ